MEAGQLFKPGTTLSGALQKDLNTRVRIGKLIGLEVQFGDVTQVQTRGQFVTQETGGVPERGERALPLRRIPFQNEANVGMPAVRRYLDM